MPGRHGAGHLAGSACEPAHHKPGTRRSARWASRKSVIVGQVRLQSRQPAPASAGPGWLNLVRPRRVADGSLHGAPLSVRARYDIGRAEVRGVRRAAAAGLFQRGAAPGVLLGCVPAACLPAAGRGGVGDDGRGAAAEAGAPACRGGQWRVTKSGGLLAAGVRGLAGERGPEGLAQVAGQGAGGGDDARPIPRPPVRGVHDMHRRRARRRTPATSTAGPPGAGTTSTPPGPATTSAQARDDP